MFCRQTRRHINRIPGPGAETDHWWLEFLLLQEQEAHMSYDHLSIRDFTLTPCQRGAYLHTNRPIVINKNQQLYMKAEL